MSGKVKSHPLNGVHTAGIFADMTVDGPEIGTLVLIVDRAKNLPNRKTIGKQDPYCAARLGKEARKTKTDIRGGQTPRWDQELRFVVHDSPDYYQLKVSVFHDDKRTDLIGETWIDLKDMIVPGGNQNDLWHNLSYRGKYAGEIRIELTFYDSRPKPEKPAAKAIQPEADVPENGSARGRGVKRRPLPSDPVTGEAPIAPQELPALPQSGPRLVPKQPSYIPNQSPLQNIEYNTPPPQRQYPTEHYTPSPLPGSQGPPQSQPLPDYAGTPPLQLDTPPRPPQKIVERYDTDSVSQRSLDRYDNPGAPPPQWTTDTYEQRALEQYDARPPSRSIMDQYGNSPLPAPSQYDDRDRNHHPRYHSEPPELDYRQEQRMDNAVMVRQPSYATMHDPYGAPPTDSSTFQLPPDDTRPPPPPVHRSLHNSGSSHEIMVRGSFDASPTKATPPMRHDVLRNEAHRNSMPALAGRPPYRTYDTSPAGLTGIHGDEDPYEPSPPRHHSYDSAADSHCRSMQPTVEDAPDSPSHAGPHGFRNNVNRRTPQYDDRRYDGDATPAPLNLSGRGSSASGRYSVSPLPSQHSPLPTQQPRGYDTDRYSLPSHQHSRSYEDHPVPYQSQNPPLPQRQSSYEPNGRYSPATSPAEPIPSNALVPRKAYLAGQYNQQPYNDFDDVSGGRGAVSVPQVPSTLASSLDPMLVKELADRIYEERRNEKRYSSRNTATPPRGRYYSEPPGSQGSADSPRGYGSQATDERSAVTFTSRPTQIIKPRAISPAANPNHRIKRKSVSPVPPSAEERRLSEIPYGPDSFDALNSSFSSNKNAEPEKPDYSDPNAKIITHDGREIDPSDHLPMESWAPEPEPKNTPPTRDSRQYPSPGGPQPHPQSASGRRQLRIAGRPQSMANPVTYTDDLPRTPPAPSSGGRNRLQKKQNRMSTIPAPSSSPAGSSPLAPISSHNYQDGGGSGFTPPRPSRASTWDHENHAPKYGSPSGTMRGGPTIPAKIPMPVMSGALVTEPIGRGGTEDWALMQEMSRIDIGAGRSRRHGRGY